MLGLAPNPRAIFVKHKRHRRHHSTQAGHDSQSVRHTHILVERRSHNHHATRSDVPDHRGRCERTGGVDFVGVDDVLVTGVGGAWSVLPVSFGGGRKGKLDEPCDEDAEDAVTKQNARTKWTPNRNVRARSPCHPEEADGNGDGTAKH